MKETFLHDSDRLRPVSLTHIALMSFVEMVYFVETKNIVQAL
jgi:hypothetical protein